MEVNRETPKDLREEIIEGPKETIIIQTVRIKIITEKRIQKVKTKLCCCILLLACSTLFVACGKKEVYYQFKQIKNGEWNVDSLLVFDLDTLLMEKEMLYDIHIEVTNNISYPYQNLWLFTSYVVNDSIVRERQTQFVLADKNGVWTGKGFGSLYQSTHLWLGSYRFKEIKDSRIYVKHGMTDSVLKGVEKVGIKIEKVQ